ncbi:glycosyltransferase 87 family protein [Actinokineospora globicatena]|uniref:Conserved hypothtical membrane protein n=1 Tax=Actinokineospora globicatena TaxID=103729 RepID=A0A9W6V935_9PSEU|nr:glycosyltransferase 87 family protein [Actinokineospora globicatena]GLW94655.1 conserved hypothtical membrane protein [Actinokineospora globicatena]
MNQSAYRVVPAAASGIFAVVVLVLAVRADAIDLSVYRAAAEIALSGGNLYAGPVWRDLAFTYPPFAAVVFAPLAVLPPVGTKVLAVAGNSALLVFVVRRSWLAVGARPTWVATSLVVGFVLLAESVHASVYVGQINLVLVALVLGDLTGCGRGIGVGVAAGLKLTPLLFVVYLVVLGRFRDAAVAVGVAIGTVVVGFVILPADSVAYWFGGVVGDPSRIYADLTSSHNQSLRGLLLRAGLPELWPWIAALVCLVTFLIARRCDRLLAVTLVGLCAAAVSPWSWGHHWVWVIPLTVVVADRVFLRGQRIWAVPGVLLLATFPWVLALADPPDGAGPAVLTGGPLWFLVGNLYLVLFAVVLALAANSRTGPAEL